MNRLFTIILCGVTLLGYGTSFAMDMDGAAHSDEASPSAASSGEASAPGVAHDEQQCSICYERLSAGDNIASSESLPFRCTHPDYYYHVSCMTNWITTCKSNGRPITCPLCRRALRLDRAILNALVDTPQAHAPEIYHPAPQAAGPAHAEIVYNTETFLNAATSGNLQTVLACLDHGVNVNSQGAIGWTALMKAAEAGHLDVVQALLSRPDINVNSQSATGWAALMSATLKGHLNIVQALLQHPNINVNIQSANGYTSLISATCHGYLDIVQALLHHPGIDVNHQMEGRDTALSFATRWYPAIQRILIEHGAV